jgi:hypothetical protein
MYLGLETCHVSNPCPATALLLPCYCLAATAAATAISVDIKRVEVAEMVVAVACDVSRW